VSDPKPLLSGEMSPYARSLLVAGKKESPQASTEAAVLTALGVGAGLAATSLLAASASAARPLYLRALKAGWHLLTSKIGIAVLAASAGLGTGWVAGTAHQRDVEAAAVTIQRPVPAAAVAVAASAAPAQEPTPEPPVATPVNDLPDAPVVAPPAPEPAASTAPERKRAPAEAVARAPSSSPPEPEPQPAETVAVTPPSSDSTLSKQLAAIQDARSAVLSKNGRAALADVDRYDREHPDGSFAEEALALRVEALRLMGDEEGARNALERLRTRYPTSVHLKKLAR
jgi:type IV secretory pathway VirB10-like protein